MSIVVLPAIAKLISLDEQFELRSGENLLQTGAKMYPLASGYWRISGYANGKDVLPYVREYNIPID